MKIGNYILVHEFFTGEEDSKIYEYKNGLNIKREKLYDSNCFKRRFKNPRNLKWIIKLFKKHGNDIPLNQYSTIGYTIDVDNNGLIGNLLIKLDLLIFYLNKSKYQFHDYIYTYNWVYI